MLEECPKCIPNLVLPNGRFSGNGKSTLEFGSLLNLRPDNNGWLEVDVDNGSSFKLTKEKDLLKLFPSALNLTYSPLNELDCFTKVLSRAQRRDLIWFKDTEFSVNGDTYKLFWIPESAKIRIQLGGNTRTTRTLVNASAFLRSKVSLSLKDPFLELGVVARKLEQYHKIIPLSLYSIPSTTSSLLVSECWNEFKTFQDLVEKGQIVHHDLEIWHQIFRGGRQETRLLGTFDGLSTDMEKAYLKGLARCPGLSGNVRYVYRGDKYLPNAHPGSWYKIHQDIPLSYSTFPPSPIKLDRIYYPGGEFSNYVTKPYLDILIQQGDIKFEILESCQIVLKNPDYLPFNRLAQYLKFFEDNYKEELYPLQLKLHYPVAGHFLCYYEDVNRDGSRTWGTSTDYNPLFACAIQGTISAENWNIGAINDTIAHRSDTLTIKRDLVIPDKYKGDYKEPEEGEHFFLTSILKDNPKKTTYKDLAYKNRDMKFIEIDYSHRISFLEGYAHNSTGKLVERTSLIKPNAGNRFIKKDIKRIGELLDNEFDTGIPNARELEEGALWLPHQRREREVDLYFTLFRPIQT